MKKLNLNTASKTYINGTIASIIALLIITGVVFLLIVANKLDIVMNEKPGITYTYFIMIMDRIITFVLLFSVLPLSLYQWFSKNKSSADKIVSIISMIIALIFSAVLIFGEMHFYDKYQNGELTNSTLFSVPTIEMKLFQMKK